MGLTIKRPVLVKVKVTEKFRQQMAYELQESLGILDKELQQLDFQEKRMIAELEKKNPSGIQSAKNHIDNEKRKRLNAKNKLTEKLKNLGKTAIGSEVVQGSLESYTEINIGDDWNEIMGLEVIVCDNKIIDIKRRKSDSHE
jgi:hypothetical protein